MPYFTYSDKGRSIRMPYCEAPSEGFDDPDILCAWAREAYAAALRTKEAKAKPAAEPEGGSPAHHQAPRSPPGIR